MLSKKTNKNKIKTRNNRKNINLPKKKTPQTQEDGVFCGVMHRCRGWTGSQPGTLCVQLPLCHSAHLRWHRLLCQVLGGLWGAECCCHVEEQTTLAFQG